MRVYLKKNCSRWEYGWCGGGSGRKGRSETCDFILGGGGGLAFYESDDGWGSE